MQSEASDKNVSTIRQHVSVVDGLVLLGSLLILLALTWPLVLHLDTHVYGGPGDNYEYVWKMWWFEHALFDLHESPLVVPHVFYPEGYLMAYGEITPLNTVFLLPFTLLFGATAVYNLSMLSSGPLSAWMMYRFARRILRKTRTNSSSQRLGALFAAALFTFSAYRQIRLAGHLPLIHTEGLVLAFWGLDCWLETRRPKDTLLVILGISLSAWSSWYYAMLLLLTLPVYAIAYDPHPVKWIMDRRSWIALGLVAVAVGVLTVPFMLPYRDVISGGVSEITNDEATHFSAQLFDYVSPNLWNPWWGEQFKARFWLNPGRFTGEHYVSLGWVGLLFAMMGFQKTKGPSWRAIKWTALVAVILSLGPEFRMASGDTGLPMPVRGLQQILPFVDGMRVWARFSIVMTIGLGVVAGAGIAVWLTPKPRKSRRISIGIVFVLLAITLWPRDLPVSKIEPRPVDRWLAEQPGNFAIMQFPLKEAFTGSSELYTRYHGKNVVFGYGTYFPTMFMNDYPQVGEFPADAALDQLAVWEVKYILVALNRMDHPETLYSQADIDAQPRLQHVITLDDQAVYELLE